MRRVTLLALLALGLPTAALASSTTIPVTNPSFEDLGSTLNEPCPGQDCKFNRGPIPGWTGGESGQLVPSVGDNGIFDSFAPRDGKTSAYANSGTISQTVDATVEEGLIYTLTLEIGHREDTAFTGSADLLVGDRKFMATGSVPSPGHWSQFTATFVGTAANEGDQITIQLNSSGIQANFDSVKLTSTPVPETGTLGLLGSGLIGLAGVVRRKLKLPT